MSWASAASDPLADIQAMMEKMRAHTGHVAHTVVVHPDVVRKPHRHCADAGARRRWRLWRRVHLVGYWVWFGGGGDVSASSRWAVPPDDGDPVTTRIGFRTASVPCHVRAWTRKRALRLMKVELDATRPADREL